MECTRLMVGWSCLLMSVVALSRASPARSYSDQDLLDALRISRRNMCILTRGKCFTTAQCCNGLVCAAIDDYSGLKPEVPGFCVKEKDLKVCETNADCDFEGKCLALGRSDERYCLPRNDDRLIASAEKGRKPGDYSKVAGKLGSVCEDDSDCRPFTSDGAEKLCCQTVRRGRQGARQSCDRVTAISVCTPVRK